MKKIRGIVPVIYLLTFLAIGGYIYFMFNGTPWGKYYFRKHAEQYIKKVYPNEVILKVEDRYSFKEMDYRTRFYTKSGNIISIYLGNNGKIKDYISK